MKEAESRYRAALELDGEDFASLCGLGLLLLQNGNFGEAKAIWRRAVAVERESAEARNGLAGALTGLKQYDSAIRQYEKAIALNPNFAEACNNLGYVYQLIDKNRAAVPHFERALRLNPQFPEAHNNLGNALMELGEIELALDHYQTAIAVRPDYLEAYHNLATGLSSLGSYEEALSQWKKALALNPKFASAYVGMGDVLVRLDRLDEAFAHFQKAIAVKSDYPEAYLHLGDLLYDRGRIDEAVCQYKQALAYGSDNAAAQNSLGIALKTLGRMDEAGQAFEKAIICSPGQMAGYYNLAYCGNLRLGDPHVVTMRKISKTASRLSDMQQLLLLFGLSKAYSDSGEHQQSFDYLLRANTVARRVSNYDEAKTLRSLERTETVFTRELLHKRLGCGFQSDVPIFIVGMPRSGTTLVEQILASHPQVFGAGELNDVSRVVRNMVKSNAEDYPEIVPTLTDKDFREQGEWYIRAIRSFNANAHRITDKLPTNFVHVGLINLILPHARIIHIRRDPIDTAMSCFSFLFLRRNAGLGFNFSYDLAELGRFYRSYRRLMAHWRAALPPGVMLEVDYEHIVDDFENQARNIVAHCGLEWDDACAKFYESKRAVTTPSATQVRRPIYNTSVGRWRPSEEHLQPFTDALNVIEYRSGRVF